jgi:hypothetical protein
MACHAGHAAVFDAAFSELPVDLRELVSSARVMSAIRANVTRFAERHLAG